MLRFRQNIVANYKKLCNPTKIQAYSVPGKATRNETIFRNSAKLPEIRPVSAPRIAKLPFGTPGEMTVWPYNLDKISVDMGKESCYSSLSQRQGGLGSRRESPPRVSGHIPMIAGEDHDTRKEGKEIALDENKTITISIVL